jgi:methyl-accepting chemotaxis protein
MLNEIQNIIREIREFRKEVSDAIEKINEKLNDLHSEVYNGN